MSLRVPELYDSVFVVDHCGRQGHGMVIGLAQPGRPDSPVVVRPVQGLAGNWSRPWPFSSNPARGCWSWPAAATPDPFARHPLAPRRGDRVQVVQSGRLVGATVIGADDSSDQHTPVLASPDGEYLGGLPAERSYRFSPVPAEGCWSWPR